MKPTRVSVRVTVLTVMSAILLAATTANLYISYTKATEAARLAANHLMRQVTATVFERLTGTLGSIDDFSRLSALLPEMAASPGLVQHPLDAYLLTKLAADSQILSVNAGYSDGNLYQVLNLRQLDSASVDGIELPPAAAFAIHQIQRTPARLPVEYWHFLNRDRRLVGYVIRKTDIADPRDTPWYSLGIESSHNVYTDSYVLPATGQLVRSIATRIDGKTPGVWGMEIPWSGVSQFLNKQHFNPSARLLIFRDDGVLLADSNLDREARGESVALNDSQGGVVSNVRALLRDMAQASESTRQAELQVAQEHWLLAVTALPGRFGQGHYLVVMTHESEFSGPINTIRDQGVIISLASLAIGAIFVLFLSGAMTKPLTKLAKESTRIMHFDFADRPQVHSWVAEIDDLGATTFRMKNSLMTFSKYMPKSLVRELIDSDAKPVLGGEERNVTIMFSDVENFTDLSERMAPTDLMRKISAHYEQLYFGISETNGIIEKYLGDGVLAIWNAPRLLSGHATHACRAALICAYKTNRKNLQWQGWGWPVLHARFGLNTGDVVAGNVGTDDRMEYTVVGSDVNLASRVEGLNKVYGTQILVTESVVQAADPVFVFRSLDWVLPKGVKRPIKIFELLGLRPGVDEVEPEMVVGRATVERVAQWEEAHALYFSNRWHEAIKAYDRLLEATPNDAAVRLFRSRAQSYAMSPPTGASPIVQVYNTK